MKKLAILGILLGLLLLAGCTFFQPQKNLWNGWSTKASPSCPFTGVGANYNSCFPINCTLMTSGTPIMINGSNGFTLGGYKQLVWTTCAPNLILYYNNYSSYAVANNTTQFPMEIENGNMTNYNPFQIWNGTDNATAVFHMNSNNGYNSVGTINATPRNGTVATGEFGNGIKFNATAGQGWILPISLVGSSWGAPSTIIMWFTSTSNAGNHDMELWGSQKDDNTAYMKSGWVASVSITKMVAVMSSGGVFNGSTTVFPSSTMQMVTFDIDTSYAEYINATLDKNLSGPASAVTSNPTGLGYNSYAAYVDEANSQFNGTLDEVRIYKSQAKTAAYISQIYNNAQNIAGYGNIGASETNPLVIITAISVVPSNATSIQNVSCNVTALSNNSATMNGSGNFTINGTVNVPFTFTGLANNTATLVANLTNGNYTRGSNISCSAYVNDGTADSSINTSANITIVPNYAPVITYNLSLNNASTSHSFTATAGASDANGGTDIVACTMSISAGSCAYLSNSTAGIYLNCTFNCTGTYPATPSMNMTFTDSFNATANTSTVSNAYPDHAASLAAPSVSSPIINTSTASYTPGNFSDLDSDIENTSNRSQQWYRNGTLIAGQTNATLNLSAIVAHVGENFSVCGNASAQNWTASKAGNCSANVTVTDPIALSQISPLNGTQYTNTSNVTFSWSCTSLGIAVTGYFSNLTIDGVVNQSNVYAANGSVVSISLILARTPHNWTVNCVNTTYSIIGSIFSFNITPVFTLLNPNISSVIFNASTFVQKNVSATNQSASAYLLQANYVGNRSSINMTCSMSPSISGITVYVAQSFNVSASLPCNGSTVATAANNTNLTWWAWASFYFPSNRSAAINISFGGG